METLLQTTWLMSWVQRRSAAPRAKSHRAAGDSTLDAAVDSGFGGPRVPSSRRYALKRLPITLA